MGTQAAGAGSRERRNPPRTGAVKVPVEKFRGLCCVSVMGLDGDTGQLFLSFSFEAEVTGAHSGSLSGVRPVSEAFGACSPQNLL